MNLKLTEKPQYGWYVKGLIVSFSIIGLIGLFLFIFGFVLQGLFGIIFIFSGLLIILLFLWPGIGMAILNVVINLKMDSDLKMEALNQIKAPKILDIGCGTGRTAIKIAKNMKNGGHLYGIDIYSKLAISGNALMTVNKNARIEEVDDITTFKYGLATEIPFKDEKFDIVNVSSVLHEIHNGKEQEKAIKEIYRVLKPEGYLYFSEWNKNSWQLVAYMGIFCLVFEHYKYWMDLIKNNGFSDISYYNKGGFVLFEARKSLNFEKKL